MIKYFRMHFINFKIRMVSIFILILQIGISLLFLKLDGSNIDDLFMLDINEYFRKIIFINKILMFLFISILIYDHNNSLHIPEIIRVGRFKYFLNKLLFFLFYIFYFYLAIIISNIVMSVFFIKEFNLNLEIILNLFKPLIDFTIFIFIALIFIKSNNRTFTFLIVPLFVILGIVYTDYKDLISFYKYLIPISNSSIYEVYNGYIYLLFYFLILFFIYILKSNLEDIKY